LKGLLPLAKYWLLTGCYRSRMLVIARRRPGWQSDTRMQTVNLIKYLLFRRI
jgi:hypothetical protein